MLALLALHAIAAVLIAAGRQRLGRSAVLVAGAAPLATFVWALWMSGGILSGEPLAVNYQWVPGLGLSIDVFVDAFALLMVLLISGVGVLIFAYTFFYMGDDSKVGDFCGLLVAFAGAMLGVVVADNLLFLFVFWELTSITSFLLIGFKDEKAAARAAALQALLVTGAGGLALLGGIVLVGLEAGTFSMRAVLESPPTTTMAAVGVGLMLLGAFTKSAQVPFHFWLPGAMAAPTPVSAYLHSATMVKAGVYLVARLSPAFSEVFGWWVPVVVGVGLLSMLVGGIRALYQTDLKLLLALGTVSQLGFLIALFGTGNDEIMFAAVALLLAHGVFKATLFMVVGIVDHQTGTRDLRKLTGMWRVMRPTAMVAGIAVASMVGLPLMFGFVAKEAVLEGLLHWGDPWSGAATALVVLGATFTAAYGTRFLWGGFADKRKTELLRDPVDPDDVAAPEVGILLPAALLTAVTVVLGIAPGAVDQLVGNAAAALVIGADGFHLAAWHGFGPPLLLSAISVAAGVGLFAVVRRGWGAGLAAAIPRRVPTPTSAYTRSLFGLNAFANRTTSIVQPGSLPFYTGVILITVIVIPGISLMRAMPAIDRTVFAESPIQVVAAIAVIIGAIGAATASRRIGAVIFLGAVGYSVALIFVIQGAPDLALTQVLVETLTLAIFVLVLRLLPVHFEQVRWPLQRGFRILVASALGVFVTGFALAARSARIAEPVSQAHVDLALPEGGGKNIVNVILTDFRAFDTLGEITVLAVAALGILALARAVRRTEPGPDPEEHAEAEVTS